MAYNRSEWVHPFRCPNRSAHLSSPLLPPQLYLPVRLPSFSTATFRRTSEMVGCFSLVPFCAYLLCPLSIFSPQCCSTGLGAVAIFLPIIGFWGTLVKKNNLVFAYGSGTCMLTVWLQTDKVPFLQCTDGCYNDADLRYLLPHIPGGGARMRCYILAMRSMACHMFLATSVTRRARVASDRAQTESVHQYYCYHQTEQYR